MSDVYYNDSCMKFKDVRKEVMKLFVVILLLVPSIFFILYFSKDFEHPIYCKTNSNFTIDTFTFTYMNKTTKNYETTTICGCNISRFVNISNIDFYFQKSLNNYTKEEILDSFVYGNSSNNLTNYLARNGQYLIRTLNINQNFNDSLPINVKFKMPIDYRLIVVKVSLLLFGNYTLDFYATYDSDNNYKISTGDYEILMTKFEFNGEKSYKYTILSNFKELNMVSFSVFDISFR